MSLSEGSPRNVGAMNNALQAALQARVPNAASVRQLLTDLGGDANPALKKSAEAKIGREGHQDQ